jgi:hypothetical protein
MYPSPPPERATWRDDDPHRAVPGGSCRTSAFSTRA